MDNWQAITAFTTFAAVIGKRISFQRFLRYGIPTMLLQLVPVGIYLALRFLVLD